MKKITSIIMAMFVVILFCGAAMAAEPVATDSVDVNLTISDYATVEIIDMDDQEITELNIAASDYVDGIGSAAADFKVRFKTNFAGHYNIDFVPESSYADLFGDGKWQTSILNNSSAVRAPGMILLSGITISNISRDFDGSEFAEGAKLGTITVTVTDY